MHFICVVLNYEFEGAASWSTPEPAISGMLDGMLHRKGSE